jgi:hypothetical protein
LPVSTGRCTINIAVIAAFHLDISK